MFTEDVVNRTFQYTNSGVSKPARRVYEGIMIFFYVQYVGNSCFECHLLCIDLVIDQLATTK